MSDEEKELENEEKEVEVGELNPDMLEEALGGDDTQEFEEDDSDGVYLKPKKNTDEEDELDMPFSDDEDVQMWKL